MKTFTIALAALAALSTAAFAAGNRSWELREAPTYYGKYSENVRGPAATSGSIEIKGLAVGGTGPGTGETAYQRMLRLSYENDHGRH